MTSFGLLEFYLLLLVTSRGPFGPSIFDLLFVEEDCSPELEPREWLVATAASISPEGDCSDAVSFASRTGRGLPTYHVVAGLDFLLVNKETSSSAPLNVYGFLVVMATIVAEGDSAFTKHDEVMFQGFEKSIFQALISRIISKGAIGL